MQRLNTRSYKRQDATQGAKRIVILCEGSNREPEYFTQFVGIDSRISLEIIPRDSHANNSPLGLQKIAEKWVQAKGLHKQDELWFVIDTDTWGDQIDALRNFCSQFSNWHVAESNACFEVWLYFHFQSSIPDVAGMKSCSYWKDLTDKANPGGFDHRRHYLLIESAVRHSRENYESDLGRPMPGSTQLHFLASQIYEVAKRKIDRLKHEAETWHPSVTKGE